MAGRSAAMAASAALSSWFAVHMRIPASRRIALATPGVRAGPCGAEFQTAMAVCDGRCNFRKKLVTAWPH